MKRDIPLWQFAGFALSALGGTLLHFVYDWTNQNFFAAPFSGVNESTWEHMKLLFFSWFIFALVQSRFFKEYNNFWCAKLKGILVGLLLIPALFYTYNGALGKSPDWFNIVIFFISAAVTFFVEMRALQKRRPHCRHPRLAFATVCGIGILFIVFTFIPPHIPLFQDPLTGTYGLG